MQNDLHTKAIVLRRTNYGETDRILNLLTPEGKKSVLAKGVRKEKSKLAGGIELFSVSDVVIHEKSTRGVSVTASTKEHLGILTSSKMLVFYNNLLADFDSLNTGSTILKTASKVAEQVDTPDLFSLVNQSLLYLNHGISPEIIEAYYLLNLAKISGEDINLHRDTKGNKLSPDKKYFWDTIENSLAEDPRGSITANHIKLMRLILTAELKTVCGVKNLADYIPEILPVAKAVCQL